MRLEKVKEITSQINLNKIYLACFDIHTFSIQIIFEVFCSVKDIKKIYGNIYKFHKKTLIIEGTQLLGGNRN